MFKRIFKWASTRDKWQRTRRISDYRATALAVRLACNGCLQPPRFSSWWRI